MKKIRIEFQDENSTEFKVDAQGLTYRELLVAVRGLLESGCMLLDEDGTRIEMTIGGIGPGQFIARGTSRITKQHLALIADEFHLAAQHIFFTQQNQAMVQAARNQQAIAALQRGGRRNSGLIIPGGGRR